MAAVAPGITVPLNCQAYVGAGEPVAATDKMSELPALSVSPLGSRVMTGATVGAEASNKTAGELVTVLVGVDTVTE